MNRVVARDNRLIAGVDEVGRGPLAGPVVTAAVILDPARPIFGLADSKKLSAKRRQALAVIIRESAMGWALGRAEVGEIDHLNIFQATMLAMRRAVASLPMLPEEVWVDGKHLPVLPCPARAFVGGDALHAPISAASILAKVARDEEMMAMEVSYPGYGFAKHKGYGTVEHMKALVDLGATPIHRQSFAPVAAVHRAGEPKC